MSPVAIDTLVVAQQFQEAGFSKKQSAGAAHILAGPLTERASRDDTAAALVMLAAKIDGLEKRHGAKLDALEAGQAELRADVTGLRTDVAELRGNVAALRGDVTGLQTDVTGLRTDVTGLQTGFARMEAMLAKLLDGQAVLLQNDMELKRRLDERR